VGGNSDVVLGAILSPRPRIRAVAIISLSIIAILLGLAHPEYLERIGALLSDMG